MEDQTFSNLITTTAAAVFVCSAWATFWIWRGRCSGWSRLAEAYASTQRPEASARRRQSMRFLPSGTRYPWLLTVRLTVDGLYLVPSLLCRCGHTPLLIPWDDIEIQAIETYPADRLYDLRLAKQPRIHLRVGVTIAQYIRRAADNSRYFTEPAQPMVRPTTIAQALSRPSASAVPSASMPMESAV